MPISNLSIGNERGELIRPTRFLPFLEKDSVNSAFAYGVVQLNSSTGAPDLSGGNYVTPWVAYTVATGETYFQRKLYNGLWEGVEKHLITLVGGIEQLSLEFSPVGDPILGFLRPNKVVGVWWVNPITGLKQILDLDTDCQSAYLNVLDKNDPNTDIYFWYFKAGELFLRKYSENFTVAHSGFVSGLTNPIILQAGLNHRYGYQVDYRERV